MAVNQIIFDPQTQNTRNILLDVDIALIQQDRDGELDFFIKLSTSARNHYGDRITPEIIRSLKDMVLGGVGGKKWNGDSGPYDTLTEAVEDHILFMVEAYPTWSPNYDPLLQMSFVVAGA
jgi:hypothetical protein